MYFDAHSDIWCDVTTRRLNGETNVFDRCHLERLRKGGVEGSIFVIWVDPPYDVDYVKRTEQIMAAIKAETAECRSFRIVHSYDEMMKANADGKIYIFIGIEGMAAMGKDLTWIDRYYEFGCRHGILTWNEANDLGAGALSGKDYGLTDLGRETVRRMQEKGMLLDVSHLNDAGFWDVGVQNYRQRCDSEKALHRIPFQQPCDVRRAPQPYGRSASRHTRYKRRCGLECVQHLHR